MTRNEARDGVVNRHYDMNTKIKQNFEGENNYEG